MIRTVGIVSLSSGILGEPFVQHEVRLGLARLQDYGLQVRFLPHARAGLEALRAHPGSEPLVIESDSQYAINCSSKWVFGWKKNGWKNSKQEPVKNAPIIKAIDAEISKRAGKVSFRWVKGHAGHELNERCDELATTAADGSNLDIDTGFNESDL